jgi:hypothetical protein
VEADCEKAGSEKLAKEQFDNAFAAAVANRDLEAVRYWSEIPAKSVYKERDRNVIDRAREKALTRLRTDLAEAVQDHGCERARELAKLIGELDPSDTDAQDSASRCSTVMAKAPPDMNMKIRRPPRKVPAKKPDVKKPALDPAQAKAQADALVQQAQTAYVNNNHARANQLAKQALRLRAKHIQAIQILGASACYLNKEAEAKSAYNRLAAGPRGMLRTVCQKAGISLQ